MAVGTPTYMSPEQASGDAAVDGRSDIYALACVLYEMLAGEPPFDGPTAQAILARHRTDPPPSLRVVRPTVPPHVEAAIETALAKVPADRFATVDRFVAALDGTSGGPRWIASRGGVGAAGWRGRRRGRRWDRCWSWRDRPHPRSIPTGSWCSRYARAAAPPRRDAGENVATLIGYALDGTEPLRWLEGWDLLDRPSVPTRPTDAGGRPRDQPRATGRLLHRRGDRRRTRFLDVVLRLHDVAGDSIARQGGSVGSLHAAALPQLGVRAVGDLLPALLAPGRRVDLTALSERKPSAIANFLQGEQEYRRMHFSRALEHYREAVREDSALALAAVKGAAAANWPRCPPRTRNSSDLALRRGAFLPRAAMLFARGLRRTTPERPTRPSTGYGGPSAGLHLERRVDGAGRGVLPSPAPCRAARLACPGRVRARPRRRSRFTPPLLHLAQIALWRGDLEPAERLVAGERQAESDAAYTNQLSLMLRCARAGPRESTGGALRRNVAGCSRCRGPSRRGRLVACLRRRRLPVDLAVDSFSRASGGPPCKDCRTFSSPAAKPIGPPRCSVHRPPRACRPISSCCSTPWPARS